MSEEKREAALIRLPFYLRMASAIGGVRGTDRSGVIHAAMDAYFEQYPELVAQVRRAMGEAA